MLQERRRLAPSPSTVAQAGDTRSDGGDRITRIAVIVVNYRTPDLAIECLEALDTAATAFDDVRAIVVDGGSADGSDSKIAQAIARRSSPVRASLLPLTVNGGFAFANNRAMLELASEGPLPDAIALINPDARVRPGALESLAALLLRNPAAGAVGARLEHEDGRPQASAFTFPSVLGEFCRGARTRLIERLLRQPPTSIIADTAVETPWVTGAAVMFRTAALVDAGLFDEGFFLYFEETDLLRRLRAHGWEIWHEPAARVVHQGGVATQIRDPETGLPARRPIPRYWYESRRRYFALTGGNAYALVSGLAWLCGRLFWQARCLVTGARDDGALRMTRDFIRYGLWPRSRDSQASVLDFGSAAPATPAWMSDPT